MPKAILELPKMPESCRGGCPFYKVCDICDILSSWNHHMPVHTPSEGRRKDCPLKPVEDKDEQTNVKCRHCNSESVEIIARGTESILYKCKACKMEFAKLKEVEL